MTTDPRVLGLLEHIQSIEPLIRNEADVSNDLRQLSPALVEALHDIGLFRMNLPDRFGGLGLTPIEIMPIAEALARIDASVAWATVVGAGSLSFATLMNDEAAKREIMCTPRGAGAGSGSPTSYRVTRVDDGYRVSGRSRFATACTFATWIAVGGALFEGDQVVMAPAGTPRLVFGMVPASELEIVDSWHADGLRGTGSHDVVAHNVFIPEGRTFNLFDTSPRWDDPYHCVPLLNRYACELVAVGIGAAQHAIDAFIELALGKVAGGDFALVRDRGVARIELAKAMGLVAGARAYVTAAAQRVHDLAYGGRALPTNEMAALRLAMVTAAAQAAEATDLIRAVSGTSAMDPGCAIGRCWRDAHAVASHTGFGAHNLEKVGMVAFGMEPPGGI
ncbi:MAG TPA: acyl-CoA dehydrogenase family protein [Tepidiformaceae bacterium]|nr:acyl-CoA dehydrogenase family protein [Tepidiformaceae bacterium]